MRKSRACFRTASPCSWWTNCELGQDGTAHGKYRVRGDEFFLQGHFPGNPVVPGVILCEIMAQSCALLVGAEAVGKTPMYTGLDKVKFRNPVRPGDTVEVTASLERRMGKFLFRQGGSPRRG